MNVPLPFALKAPTGDKAQEYEQLLCPACTHLHLVSKSTGKLLGDQSSGTAPPQAAPEVR
jgi:hypothetical protein